MEQKSDSNIIKIIGIIFIVIVAGIVGWQVIDKSQNNSLFPTKSELAKNSQPLEKYHNGTYTATGNYQSPAQREEIEITLTVVDGVIKDGAFVSKAVHPTSKMMQGKFSEGFKEEVVGRELGTLNLTVVNGSSLTPKGFMDALEKIKKQAQS